MKKLLILFLFITSFIVAQNAADYFPAQVGHRWNFKVSPLDSLNNNIDSLSYYQVDSFAVVQNYFGKSANIMVSKSGLASTISYQPYLDTSYYNFSGSNASVFFEFTDLDTVIGMFDSNLVHLAHSFEGWYNSYRFAQSTGSNYTIFTHDTTVTIDSTSLPIRYEIIGKRYNDQSLNTEIGVFNCKKFTISNRLSYLVKLPSPLPPIVIKIVEFVDTVYIAPGNWFVKSIRPSSTIDLSILQLGSYNIPGLKTEIIQTITDVKTDNSVIPNNINLEQNYPNPFNPSTTISFNLDQSYNVELSVYDILGNLVKVLVNNELSAGRHSVEFNASQLSTGVYFYKLKAGDVTQMKKLIYIK